MTDDALEMLSLEQVAALLGIKPKTLRNRISARKNHPPVFSPSAGVFQFPKKDFLRWRDARLIKAAA